MSTTDASPPDDPALALAALRVRLAAVERERDDALALVDPDNLRLALDGGAGRLARVLYSARHDLTNGYLALNGAVEVVGGLEAPGAHATAERVARVVGSFDPAWVARIQARLHARVDAEAARLARTFKRLGVAPPVRTRPPRPRRYLPPDPPAW